MSVLSAYKVWVGRIFYQCGIAPRAGEKSPHNLQNKTTLHMILDEIIYLLHILSFFLLKNIIISNYNRFKLLKKNYRRIAWGLQALQ